MSDKMNNNDLPFFFAGSNSNASQQQQTADNWYGWRSDACYNLYPDTSTGTSTYRSNQFQPLQHVARTEANSSVFRDGDTCQKIKAEADEGSMSGSSSVKPADTSSSTTDCLDGIKQEATSSESCLIKKKRDRFNGMTEDDVLKKTVPDILSPNLDIIIIGSCPGLTAAYLGHHYAGPGNHFWKCLYLSGLITEPLSATDDYKLKMLGIGFTNFVARCSKGSVEFTRREIKDGIEALTEKIQVYKPRIAVFNGKGIYEVFCNHKNFYIGKQPEPFPGTNTLVYVMPSSSARCSQLPRASDKVPFFVALRKLRDHVLGRLPHLDESEVVFPDLDLKVEPRKDRRNEPRSIDELVANNEETVERKKRALDMGPSEILINREANSIVSQQAGNQTPSTNLPQTNEMERWAALQRWPSNDAYNALINENKAALTNPMDDQRLIANSFLRGHPFYAGWPPGHGPAAGLAGYYPPYLQYPPEMLANTFVDPSAAASYHRSFYPHFNPYSDPFLNAAATSTHAHASQMFAYPGYEFKPPSTQQYEALLQKAAYPPGPCYPQYR